MLNLLFDLKVEDDWPPVAVEGLPCTEVPGGYRVEAAPLFVKNLSAGDEISVSRSSAGHVSEWSHLRKSDRTTIWLLRISKPGDVSSALEELRRMSCNTAQLAEYGSYAIDVPGTCSISDVDAVLARLDPSQIAIAYPSFRHS